MADAVVAELAKLQAALHYASHFQWGIFPVHAPLPDGTCTCKHACGRVGKHPRTTHGYKDATNDLEQVRAWWTQHPESNIGVPCGVNRLVVIDVDPRNDGDWGLVELEKLHGELPPTLTSNTGGGGQHYIYSVPEGHADRVRSYVLRQGVELKADGCYIVLPPSLHPSRQHYVWDSGQPPEPTPAPLWMLERPTKAVVSSRAPIEGILGAAFMAAGMAGRAVGPDKIVVQCPWQNEHTCGEPLDGSTVVFGPSFGKFGAFHCSHAHCVERLANREARNALILKALPDGAVEAARKSVKGADSEIQRLNVEEWHMSRRWDAKGKLIPDAGNLALHMRNMPEWAGCVSYDPSKDKVTWQRDAQPVPGLPTAKAGDEITEHDYITVGAWFSQAEGMQLRKECVQDVLVAAASQNPRNTLQEHLSALEWDGVYRLDSWLTTYLNVEESEYSRFVGRAWLISAMARAFEPGCQVDHVLTLEGAQGLGKTSIFRMIGGDWYLGHLPNLDDKDARFALATSWICEIQELAAFKGSDATKIKAFLSEMFDRYRPPYARFFVRKPRGCVFGASTNENEYIQDSTGARRYWPVKVGDIDLAGFARDRNALLAEARDAYRAGEKWHPVREAKALIKELAVQQEDRQEKDPWEERIRIWINSRLANDGFEVNAVLDYLGVTPDRQTRRDSARAGAILRRLGWTKNRELRAGERSWVWRPVGASRPDRTPLAMPSVEPG
jgi:hypothetical protein